MPGYLLAIDQGTTSSRAIIFSSLGEPVSLHQIELAQSYPAEGWVEQNPEEMWNNTLLCCREALKKISLSANEIAAIGITNQRETTIIWDKLTGKPIYPAIVWQDRRTHELCAAAENIIPDLQMKTGLLLDPYFSATKIMWILENVPGARKRAENNELLFGTVDAFLLWRLTNKRVHATDATNASRTLLFNVHTQQWDDEILAAFNIPKSLLPRVLNSSDDFGEADAEFLGASIPIASVMGDQQAATVGQGCFKSGMIKSTYGTGCFMLLNTGEQFIQSKNKLLGTIAYRLNDKPVFGLEGSIFSAGFIVKWLRDKLKIIKSAEETETLSRSVPNTQGVYVVPAFTGLGAPYWNPHVRGAILGLTPAAEAAHIVRAALEAVGFQTRDLIEAMKEDSQVHIDSLRVDGGMTMNTWLLQFLTDIVGFAVHRAKCIETTALGAAFFAGLQVGMYKSLDDIAALCKIGQSFLPEMNASQREKLYSNWCKAVQTLLE